VASLVAIAWLVITASLYGDGWRMAGGAAFGVTALLLFGASTLYHAARRPRVKELFRKFDHSAIYLLIAGTYTAFTVGVMRGYWGWTLFAVVWVLAAFGIAAEVGGRVRHPMLSSALYVAMGWLGIVAIRALAATLTPLQLKWLLAGGILYTIGVPFYIWKSRPYTHAIWHLFVLAGVSCHFVAVLSVMRAS
jgi:hemolysin III